MMIVSTHDDEEEEKDGTNNYDNIISMLLWDMYYRPHCDHLMMRSYSWSLSLSNCASTDHLIASYSLTMDRLQRYPQAIGSAHNIRQVTERPSQTNYYVQQHQTVMSPWWSCNWISPWCLMPVCMIWYGRSCDLDEWSQEQLDIMKVSGNGVAATFFKGHGVSDSQMQVPIHLPTFLPTLST